MGCGSSRAAAGVSPGPISLISPASLSPPPSGDSPSPLALSLALLEVRGLPATHERYYATLSFGERRVRTREARGTLPVFNARLEAPWGAPEATLALYRCASPFHRFKSTLHLGDGGGGSGGVDTDGAPSVDALVGTLLLPLPPTLLASPPPPRWLPLAGAAGAPGVEAHVHVTAKDTTIDRLGAYAVRAAALSARCAPTHCAPRSVCLSPPRTPPPTQPQRQAVVGRLTLHLDAVEGFALPPSLRPARRLRVVVTHGLKAFSTSVALPDAAQAGGAGAGAGAGAAPSPPPPLPLAQLCRAWVRRGEEAYVACVELLADPFGAPPEPLARAYVPLEQLMDGAPRVVRSALAPARTAEADAAREKGELGLTDAGLNKLIAHLGEDGGGFQGEGAPPPAADAAAGAAEGEEAVLEVGERAAAAAPILGTLVLRAQFEAKSDLERAFCATVAAEFDVDKNGSLDEGELLAMLASLGVPEPCIAAEGATAHLHTAMHGPGRDGRLPLEDVARHAWAHLPMAFSLLSFLADGASSSRRLLADFTRGEGGSGGSPPRSPREMGETPIVASGGARTRGGAAAAVLRAEGRTLVDELGLVCMERATGLLVQEHIPRRIKTALKLMYHSKLGHALTHTAGVRASLKQLSVHEGRIMDAPESRANIPTFVREFAIAEEECAQPLADYATFNAFFTRRLRAGARPVGAPGEPGVVVSPADCRLVAFDTQAEACDVWVKGEAFSLAALLGPAHAALAAALAGGPILVCRLAPQDYHRFHAPLAGVVEALTPIDGALFTVNPIAVRAQRPDIFTSNKRVVVPFRTRAAGLVAFVAVGATAVGSISFTARVGDAVEKGGELGFFAFGGSTVLCIFARGVLRVDEDILSNSRKPLETIVRQGEAIARCAPPAREEGARGE